MAWVKAKLERDRQHELRARVGDTLGLFEWQGSVWLRLADEAGDDILRVYNVTEQQLADLHAQIGGRLRLAPVATIDHLRRLHALLGEVLAADAATARQAEEAGLEAWLAAERASAAGLPPDAPDAEPGAAADRGGIS